MKTTHQYKDLPQELNITDSWIEESILKNPTNEFKACIRERPDYVNCIEVRIGTIEVLSDINPTECLYMLQSFFSKYPQLKSVDVLGSQYFLKKYFPHEKSRALFVSMTATVVKGFERKAATPGAWIENDIRVQKYKNNRIK